MYTSVTLDDCEHMVFVGFLGEPMPIECYNDKEMAIAWIQGRRQGIAQGIITLH